MSEKIIQLSLFQSDPRDANADAANAGDSVVLMREVQAECSVNELCKPDANALRVRVVTLECDDLPSRLLKAYRILGILGSKEEMTNAAGIGSPNGALIREAGMNSDGTA